MRCNKLWRTPPKHPPSPLPFRLALFSLPTHPHFPSLTHTQYMPAQTGTTLEDLEKQERQMMARPDYKWRSLEEESRRAKMVCLVCVWSGEKRAPALRDWGSIPGYDEMCPQRVAPRFWTTFFVATIHTYTHTHTQSHTHSYARTHTHNRSLGGTILRPTLSGTRPRPRTIGRWGGWDALTSTTGLSPW